MYYAGKEDRGFATDNSAASGKNRNAFRAFLDAIARLFSPRGASYKDSYFLYAFSQRYRNNSYDLSRAYDGAQSYTMNMRPNESDEANRLEALHAYDILDSAPEDGFDQLVMLGATLCGTSMAVLCFVDSEREWRKAVFGTAVIEVPRAESICARMIDAREALVVSDFHSARIFDKAPIGWRFFAGAPIVTAEGFILGTLCVMDEKPHTMVAAQMDGLKALAQQAMARLELRRYQRQGPELQRDRFCQLADSMPHIVWSADRDGTIDFANHSIVEYAGLRYASDIGKLWSELLHPDDFSRTLEAWEQSVQTGEIFSAEYRLRRGSDNAYRWHIAKGIPVRDDQGNITKWYGTTTDIHDMKLAHEEIGRLAFFDTLTGLPNRQLLMDRLAHTVTLHDRIGRTGAVLLLDLDHFKNINDTIGHDNGDLLLVLVAKRLLASVADRHTVARLGGDEFVIILEDIGTCDETAAQAATKLARNILDALNASFNLDGYERHITPSIGIAFFGSPAQSITELLKRADLAMYQAKAAGRNTMRFFDPAIQEAALVRASLEAELRQGLARQEFVLFYQPQMNSAGNVIGLEALVRWNNPHRGMVSPADFILLAEDTGLILPLGRWVLEEACRMLVFLTANSSTRHLSVAVNVSALQFRQPDFVAVVLDVLHSSGAHPGRLKIELTESLLLEDIEGAIQKINELKKHGVRFSLDDFGTGYSSLTYLKRLPFNQIKIDQSFVHNILNDPRDLAIANTIIALGQTLHVAVIAEGVETSTQRDLLAQCGCTLFQGYFFSRPLPEAQLQDFLRRHLAA
ncbi:putative bifunctional diguanylate cyclase/phosphodiesterase [Pseudoduganella plicata]|uniref:Bifunctional diguanylate cyclase/phosphodiesterase n=1 Tax=Pseudoduganella plicata TaxID=321984 RepID=A0A4P7BJ23_9BURK|nr:EAL domain-containing protein [Pseudoduganella plicata]QBQ37529.1 EAL domain-containing protein [Pseudoduganella plicata]GGY90984.1 bifunctional diguanylate cyclase/phosphodiesterase [Pseudoduganella plicata]